MCCVIIYHQLVCVTRYSHWYLLFIHVNFTTATNDSLQSSSFNSPCPSRILQRADSSFEVIDDIEDDTQILNNSLAKKSLRNSLLNPLQSLTQQNKDLKELLEKCNKKMASVKEEKETMLRELEEERNKCRALEEETLRLQVEITSLHKVEYGV